MYTKISVYIINTKVKTHITIELVTSLALKIFPIDRFKEIPGLSGISLGTVVSNKNPRFLIRHIILNLTIC